MSIRSIALRAVLLCIIISVPLLCYQIYYLLVKWSSEIQNNVLGSTIVGFGALDKREGYSSYGEGVHRWYYDVDKTSTKLIKVCGIQNVERCKFTRTFRVSDNVRQTAVYSNGVLMLEEVWS